MRARPPVTRVEAQQLTVRTDLTASDGTEMAPLEVSLPTIYADLLDPTATPAVPVLVALAAARGEDLHLDGSVDARMATGAADLGRLLSSWWGTGAIRVEVKDTHDTAPTGTGVGLFFARDVDSWSTLLDVLDAPDGPPVTHLLSVLHDDGHAIDTEVRHGHHRVADDLGLNLVILGTSARPLLGPLRPWVDVADLALVSAGLVAGAGLSRLVVPGMASEDGAAGTGSDPALVATLSTTATTVEAGDPHRRRHERVAHLLGDLLARSTLHTCAEDAGRPDNCGRCAGCLTVMSALLLAGDADPAQGFAAPIDVQRTRELRLDGADDRDQAEALARVLPPEHEELRRAWADVVALSQGEAVLARWGDNGPPPMAGPGVPQRVAAGLRASTGQADAPMDRPLGWRPGSVPLRPALADHEAVRRRASQGPRRDRPWAVVEPHIRDGRRDGAQADLALRAHAAFGPGPCYLPGILWAHAERPVLGPEAVAALLGTARCRLWWREAGDLEALRVVESIEHGCLPLQVMPPGPADDLRAALPAALVGLVVADDELATFDLSPDAVSARLTPALDHLLAGCAERDLMVGAHGG